MSITVLGRMASDLEEVEQELRLADADRQRGLDQVDEHL